MIGRVKTLEEREISRAVIRRLPRYYRYLGELLKQDIKRISSNTLSVKMNVTASQIRQDFNYFGGFGHHGKNDRFRRSEACKTLFQETSETFCIHGNYLRRAAFLYPYSGLKPLPAFSGNQRNGEYISYYLKRGDVGNVLSDAYQWRHYSGKWQYCLFHEGGSDQYLGDCDPVIHVHGICGQSITGHRCVLPQCRSDL